MSEDEKSNYVRLENVRRKDECFKWEFRPNNEDKYFSMKFKDDETGKEIGEISFEPIRRSGYKATVILEKVDERQ